MPDSPITAVKLEILNQDLVVDPERNVIMNQRRKPPNRGSHARSGLRKCLGKYPARPLAVIILAIGQIICYNLRAHLSRPPVYKAALDTSHPAKHSSV
jgi:hypothetical protein